MGVRVTHFQIGNEKQNEHDDDDDEVCDVYLLVVMY